MKRDVIAVLRKQRRQHAAKGFAIGAVAGILMTDFVWVVIQWVWFVSS